MIIQADKAIFDETIKDGTKYNLYMLSGVTVMATYFGDLNYTAVVNAAINMGFQVTSVWDGEHGSVAFKAKPQPMCPHCHQPLPKGVNLG